MSRFIFAMTPFKKEKILSEIIVRATRSSGKGGQHVNKVSTKIEIRFDIQNSIALSEEEKKTLLNKLKSKLSEEGILILTSQESRSQMRNKEAGREKLILLLEKYLVPVKKRIASKPSAVAREKRLRKKRLNSELKKLRKPGKMTKED